jgi:peptidoglycan/LPS O-acetylase OafA/YrhL
VTPPRLHHVPQLDGLRALAIGLVLLHHLPVVLGREFELLRPFSAAGWIGVDVFFALSGFLITSILLGSVDQPRYWRNFYVRRGLRILPLYYGLLTLIFLTRTIAPGLPAEMRPSPWWFYGFLSNFWYAHKPVSTDFTLEITWSLSVEEQFYLLWPLMIRYLPRRVLAVGLGGLILAAPAFRYFLAAGAPSLCHTLCRVDGLAIGALAALWWFTPRAVAAPRWIGGLAVGLWATLLAVIVSGGFQLERWGVPVFIYALVPAATAATIIAVLTGQARGLARILGWRPAVAIGKVSFGLYLLHPLAFSMTRQMAVKCGAAEHPPGTLAGLGWCVGATGLAIVMAFASYQVMERKFLALKDQLAPVAPESRPKNQRPETADSSLAFGANPASK